MQEPRAPGLVAHKKILTEILSPNETFTLDFSHLYYRECSKVLQPVLTPKERFLTASFFFFLKMEVAVLTSYSLRKLLTTTKSCGEMKRERKTLLLSHETADLFFPLSRTLKKRKCLH